MRYLELFAGAGGMSMGLEAAGMVPVAHAEIEPHARAVLRHRWPETPLHGDVTQVDWTQYAGQVDLVAGGSPCQDLSVAGKRAGLAGARSGLFYELIRAWDETGATYCLWENVDGARSSNTGADLASVLSAFVGGSVAVPRDGWRRAGVVAGATGVAAWRVLDLQHFGPPQRRRRVFVLAARTGGVDPAEVLALSEGVCGHPAPREQQRQGAARGATAGAGAIGINKDSRAECVEEGIAGLRAGQRQQPAVLAPCIVSWQQNSMQGKGTLGVDTNTEVLRPVKPQPDHQMLAVPAVLTFTPGFVARGEGPRPLENLVQTLGAYTQGDQAPHIVCTTGDVTHALTHEGADASEDGTGRGTPVVLAFQQSSLAGRGTMGVDENTTVLRPVKPQADHQIVCLASGQANAEVVRDGVPTPNTIHEQPIIVGTLDVHDSVKWGSHQWVAQNKAITAAGRPRRLTPLECERLMGWPDQHTAHGVKEDGTVYALSDTARYRLCGNGVGTPVAAWIASRLMAEEAACPIP